MTSSSVFVPSALSEKERGEVARILSTFQPEFTLTQRNEENNVIKIVTPTEFGVTLQKPERVKNLTITYNCLRQMESKGLNPFTMNHPWHLYSNLYLLDKVIMFHNLGEDEILYSNMVQCMGATISNYLDDYVDFVIAYSGDNEFQQEANSYKVPIVAPSWLETIFYSPRYIEHKNFLINPPKPVQKTLSRSSLVRKNSQIQSPRQALKRISDDQLRTQDGTKDIRCMFSQSSSKGSQDIPSTPPKRFRNPPSQYLLIQPEIGPSSQIPPKSNRFRFEPISQIHKSKSVSTQQNNDSDSYDDDDVVEEIEVRRKMPNLSRPKIKPLNVSTQKPKLKIKKTKSLLTQRSIMEFSQNSTEERESPPMKSSDSFQTPDSDPEKIAKKENKSPTPPNTPTTPTRNRFDLFTQETDIQLENVGSFGQIPQSKLKKLSSFKEQNSQAESSQYDMELSSYTESQSQELSRSNSHDKNELPEEIEFESTSIPSFEDSQSKFRELCDSLKKTIYLKKPKNEHVGISFEDLNSFSQLDSQPNIQDSQKINVLYDTGDASGRLNTDADNELLIQLMSDRSSPTVS